MARNIHSLELNYIDLSGQSDSVVVDKWPDTCPVCDHGIEPIHLEAQGETYQHHAGGYGHMVQAVFRCPRQDCQAVFITIYSSYNGPSRIDGSYVYRRDSFVKLYQKTEKFDDEIETLSPNFVSTYNQSLTADDMELNLICGAGYRKALEFLIKDYLIYKKPTKKQEILDKSLGTLIVEEIDSEKIKQIAKLAKDVGNDETHYQKTLEELDIADLKKLIKITTHWISDELTLENYLSKVSSKKAHK